MWAWWEASGLRVGRAARAPGLRRSYERRAEEFPRTVRRDDPDAGSLPADPVGGTASTTSLPGKWPGPAGAGAWGRGEHTDEEVA